MSGERPPSREGKKCISVWVELPVKRRLDQLCLDLDQSAQAMMETALELLFTKCESDKSGRIMEDEAFWSQIRAAVERKYLKRDAAS